MTIGRRVLAGALTVLIGAGAPPPASAYLKLGGRANGRTVQLKWERLPMRYFITNRGVPGVTPAQFQAAVGRAFQTWQDVATATFSGTFAGFTTANPLDDDGLTTLGFLPRPDQDRVLAATHILTNELTGEIVEADIFFNSTFEWSVSPTGETGRFDVESIALHEAGHLLGLGHSAIGETELRPGGGRRVIASAAVMFPIAFSAGNVEERTLHPDDIAGVSDIYPEGEFRSRTGSISGRVTKNGQGIVGAHVVAWSQRTGALVSGFSLGSVGAFVIAGLEPGPYVLRVEPIDDADVTSFFSEEADIDVDFRAAFHDRLAVAPRGGAGDRVEIRVVPK
ncbi:MAG: matrixin family metalloprotease [Vicinamibacterales bacterium]